MPHFYIMDKSNHLAHYGIKGQQRGVRRFQNYDGTYTQAGLERYWPNSKHGERGGGKLRGNTMNYESTWKPTQTVDTIGIHDTIVRLTSDGKHRSYNGLVKELAKDPNVKNLTGIVDADIKGYVSAARKNDVNLEALLLASMRNKLRSAAVLAYSDLIPGNSDESDSLGNEMKIGFRKADEGSLIGDACVQAIEDRTRELLHRYDRANSEIDKELKKLNKSLSGLSEEDVRNDPVKEKLADKAFDDFVNSPIIKELADEYQYRYNKLAEMKGSKEYPKAYVKYMDDLSYEVATLLDHPRDATKAFNAGDGNFIDKESAVIEALHCANEAAYDGSTSRGGKTRGGHERGFGPLSLFAAGVGVEAITGVSAVAGALAYDAYSRNSVVKNCADWPVQKTEVELSSYLSNHHIANSRDMAAQIVRKMPTDVDGVQLSKDIVSGKDLKDLPSIKSLAKDIQFEFNSAMDSAVYGNDKHHPTYGMANAMKPKYIKGLDHKYDKQVSAAIYEANAEAYKQYNPSVEGQELPKIRGGKERGGEIRTFETTKFGDVKQKSSYITGTDINNGIVKATRANNEDTATAQDNAIKALKSNKSIQDVAQLVGKAYHEYVVEQADYNHVSNKKSIPLLYPSKTKQSDMQASHEKLGKAQAAMSAEIRSMMRIALEKDYNKKTPYTSKGKPITYGELANKAVMQILKESNSKANRKDMLNVTLAARDYNRKQARRGSTVDEAKLERQRSEISKLRGKVYDEWGNIIDQKAYKQLQRAKANYKKTKQG